MNTILGELGKSNKFLEITKNINEKKGPLSISGLIDMGTVELLSAINEFNRNPICLITYNEIQARKLYENLQYFSDKVELFLKKDIVTYDYVAESKDLPYERIDALNKIISKNNLIVITTIEAIMQEIPKKEVLYKNKLQFKVGDTCNLEEIKEKLHLLGYARYDLIEGKSQFSIRGDIIDIATDEKNGIRIELWGDEIDSIRTFNLVTQRSINNMVKAVIYPAHEYIFEKDVNKICNKIRNLKEYEKHEENIEEDIEQIQNGEYISKVDKYFDCFYDEKSNVLEYLKDDYLLVFDEFNKIEQRSNNINKDIKELKKNLIEKEKMIPQALNNIRNIDDIKEQIYNSKNQLIYIEKQDNKINTQSEKYHFEYREINYYKSTLDLFVKDVEKYLKDKSSVYILVDSKEKAKKVAGILNENDINNLIEEKLNQTIIVKSREKIATISVGNISNGFECIDLKQIVICADDLVDSEKRKKKRTHSAYQQGEKVVFADLSIGDYVVHKIHGIGIYIGVNTIKADNTIKDYIKIKYKNDDILYVPTNQMDSVRKYVGGDSRSPKINRLGSKDWENTKARVKNNLREMAKELIELYARRDKMKGYAFGKDTPWQAEFENQFQYQETDDQLRCIEEIKKDMESTKPMDRLLCGDVGYGKTEVALRAAFKAVMDQKQVAYLTPTTVLADQQYQEFKERMENFAIKVEVLNRFRTPKEQKEIVRKLKLGEIDVIVGTHRILSKDVEFKDLGLLIIDEEHRFGVQDKEKIKQYKTNIDVLTMTATPIPRTLQMSIVGVRDMSIIYEPPHNRKPVKTYVLEYDQDVVKEAITKELERDGQIFYIFNNVDGIQRKADEISQLVPESRVAYAHGKMTGTKIEDIMKKFINKEFNVLICTTILESGIDIPNANTIIIENSDRMGLAQLYQIRGRVGRADRQAYAYITYKRDKLLAEVADKRLKTIKEFTEFGSGFKIAMRDLEIRGAGSLFGEIQSGHLEQVGYDTYCNLLDQVVKEMKGIEVKEEQDIQIDLNVTSYIPDEYISDSNQKIEIYQNIALCKNEEDIVNVIDEIIDRFGNMPNELENLIEIARIKYLAKNVQIEKIASKQTAVLFTFGNDKINIDVNLLIKEYGNKIKFGAGIKPRITLDLGEVDEKEILKQTIQFCKKLQQK